MGVDTAKAMGSGLVSFWGLSRSGLHERDRQWEGRFQLQASERGSRIFVVSRLLAVHGR